jgi:glycosyltransferase involved in cell wall biosynthesis
MRIAVGIPTSGRPEILSCAIDCIGGQTRAPDRVVVCAARPSDLAGLTLPTAGSIISAPSRGLTPQRNVILDHCEDVDVIAFFDDDFLPHAGYLAAIERAFAAHPDVVMITGRVVADGIIGPGLSLESARRILDRPDIAPAPIEAALPAPTLVDVYNGYGCNMAVRVSAIAAGPLRFDESLPLYGWLEDVDFSRRLARRGRIAMCPLALGVHLGTKSARLSGVRLGYSQVANPLYLARKGTMATHRAVRQILRNVAMNVARSVRPESYIDRRGRLWGNVLGAADLLTNRLAPTRVLRLPERASSIGD